MSYNVYCVIISLLIVVLLFKMVEPAPAPLSKAAQLAAAKAKAARE